jgi:hypothetical protein
LYIQFDKKGESNAFVLQFYLKSGDCMKRYKVLFLSLFFILFFIMIGAIWWVSAKAQDNKLAVVSDNVLRLFRHELEIQKSNALFLSVALSSDRELKEALKDEEEDLGYRLLLSKLENLKAYTFIQDVRIQLISKDLYIFARSWDNTFAGMPLEGLRVDLQRIRKLRKPKVSIDPGRLLTIKATTPIKEGVDTIGYMEAVKTFDALTSLMRKRGIELTILMDDRFLDVATLMRENPAFGTFVVSNRNYNSVVYQDLKQIESSRFESEKFLKSGQFFHILDTMRDSAGEKIGVYVLSIQKSKLDAYDKIQDNISFFLSISKKDLYDVVSQKEQGGGAFRSVYDRAFMDVLGSIDASEKAVFVERAKEILHDYSKEELIDILLDKQYKNKISGEIR